MISLKINVILWSKELSVLITFYVQHGPVTVTGNFVVFLTPSKISQLHCCFSLNDMEVVQYSKIPSNVAWSFAAVVQLCINVPQALTCKYLGVLLHCLSVCLSHWTAIRSSSEEISVTLTRMYQTVLVLSYCGKDTKYLIIHIDESL